VLTGPDPIPGLIDPVAGYDHFEATAGKITRIAIIGSFVYRGSEVPALRGRYVCADLNGFLFDVDLGAGRIEQQPGARMVVRPAPRGLSSRGMGIGYGRASVERGQGGGGRRGGRAGPPRVVPAGLRRGE
jgi:hypothetical protein